MMSLNLGSSVLHIPNTDACIPWPLHISSNGYGMKTDRSMKSRVTTAHRWVYQKLVGDIPEGLAIDHLCRNRACVNPRHLEPVTPAENNRRTSGLPRRRRQLREQCKRGHSLLDGTNVIVRATGKRQCRTCVNVGQRLARHARRTDPPRS